MGRVSRVLDWSKPLKDQPAFVVAAVRAALKPRRAYNGDGEVGGDTGVGAGDNDGGPNDAGAGNGPSAGAGEGTDTYSNTAGVPGIGLVPPAKPGDAPSTPDWIGPKPSDPLNTAWRKLVQPGTGTPSVGKTFALAELPELNRGGAVARALRVVRRSSK